MKHSYLQKTTFVGFDWHDMHTRCDQMLDGNSPKIKDVKKLIVDDICAKYPLADRNEIEKLYDDPTNGNPYLTSIEIECSGIDDEVTTELIEGVVKIGWAPRSVFYANLEYQFSVETKYYPEEIDDANAVYLPVREYHNGLKYGDTVERFFHEPFTSYEEAMDYIKHTTTNQRFVELGCADAPDFYPEERDKIPLCDQYGAYQVIVFDKNELTNKNWFQLNMEAISLMKELGVTEYDCFRRSVEQHINALNELKEQRANPNMMM